MKVWPGYWKNQLKRMHMKVNEDNGKATGTVNRRYQKVWRFSSNGFLMDIGFLVSAPNFGIGGSRLWDKEENIETSGNKKKRRSIQIKIDLYEVCLSGIIYFLLFYFKTILTPFFFVKFLVYLSLGERSSESIGHKDLSRNRIRQHMNGGG